VVSDLARKVIRHGSFASVEDLKKKMSAFIHFFNYDGEAVSLDP
jgi:hypothetical protein